MEKINVGFIGLGRIADLHRLGYEKNQHARIYAVCDRQEDLAEKRMGEWGAVKKFTDYHEMLADPDLDAVEILSPHDVHEVMTLDAMASGKHIALQKPMTVSLESADRMIGAARQTKKIFKVTDNYLFYPPIVRAKKLMREGAIGAPSNIRIKMISGASGGWRVPDASWEWRLLENEKGRGLQTFDHGHHLWATAWFLLGEIERVVSWIDSADGVIDCPAVMMWKYRDGKKYGMCEYTFGHEMEIPSKYYANDEWIEITGSKGIILINRCTGNILDGPAISLFKDGRWEYFDAVDSDWAAGFVGATNNFIRSIRGEEAPLLTCDQAREILKMSLAIGKSAELGKEVLLDEYVLF